MPSLPKPPDELDYQALGVSPPEHVEHGIKDEDLEQKFAELGKRSHVWYQQGQFLKCDHCPNAHGHVLKMDEQFIGCDASGVPRFRKIVVKPNMA